MQLVRSFRYLIVPFLLIFFFLFTPDTAISQKLDTDGKPITHGKASIIAPTDSRVSFTGAEKHEIVTWKRRLRDNGIPQEQIRFKNDTSLSSGPTSIFLETATTMYNERVTELFNDDDWLLKRAKRRIKDIDILVDLKEGSNTGGNFKYLIAGDKSSPSDKCLFAQQLFTAVETSAPGARFRDGLSYLYCRKNTSEKELLEYYNSIRIINN